ncbi:hypothetical protein DKX38_023240 [Salix brachista]|uniref:Kinesin motor domain-containing protein n=1 Tax=Salix brachista TaxID=2182728 RepID=A0A5N5K1M0_9ROSI|nr:hypothetical protein DKX38_023240 [Salix brachista]
MTGVARKQDLNINTKEVSPVAAGSITCEATILDTTDDDNNKIALSTRELSMLDEGKKIDKESSSSIVNQDGWPWPPIDTQLQEIINNVRSLCSSIYSCMDTTPHNDGFHTETSTDIGEPTTLNSSMRVSNTDITSFSTWEKFTAESTRIKNSLAQDYLRLLNTADKEVLKKLKGIGEKRATYILELREDSPEPFKNLMIIKNIIIGQQLDDLKVIGLSAKQVQRWF